MRTVHLEPSPLDHLEHLAPFHTESRKSLNGMWEGGWAAEGEFRAGWREVTRTTPVLEPALDGMQLMFAAGSSHLRHRALSRSNALSVTHSVSGDGEER